MSKTRIDIIEKEKEIKQWIEEGKTKQDLCNFLKCQRKTLLKYLHILNIDYKYSYSSQRKDLSYYLKKDFYINNTNVLKYRLIKEGYKKHKCEKCSGTTWLGELIPIELHHIDGDRSNNLIENLQILCNNCHTLTENYKSKNKDIIKNNSHYCGCGNIKSINSKKCKECYIKYLNLKKENKNCLNCDKKIKINSSLCTKCFNLNQRKIERPPYEELISLIDELGYVGTGKKYNVSDNAIRKWIKFYNKHK